MVRDHLIPRASLARYKLHYEAWHLRLPGYRGALSRCSWRFLCVMELHLHKNRVRMAVALLVCRFNRFRFQERLKRHRVQNQFASLITFRIRNLLRAPSELRKARISKRQTPFRYSTRAVQLSRVTGQYYVMGLLMRRQTRPTTSRTRSGP